MLPLAACGEDWEMQLTNTPFPYGNQRTAGTGVAYVLAKMMPERSLNLTPVKRDHAPEAIPPAQPITDFEPIFKKTMRK